MSNQTNGQTSTSPVTTTDGTKVQIVNVPDLTVPANRIAGFVAQYKKTYFEDHGLEWCLDEIISRGMAEIKRQVKTAIKTRENKVSGDLLRAYNLTPAQALEVLKLAKEQAEAKSTK